jgi:hypothetical protein
MSEQLTPILSLANNSMDTLIALANAIVNTMATTMVTVNAAANGALTNGNGYVSGIFGAAVFAAGFLRGGNVQAAANLVIGSNTYVNSGSFSVGNSSSNSVVNSIAVSAGLGQFTNVVVGYFPQAGLSFANSALTGVDTTTSGLGTVTLDTFPLATTRTAEYIIQVTDNTANNYQSSKFFVTHNGSVPLWTEYALLTTNNVIMTFSAITNATTLILQASPGATNTSIRVLRTSMNA